MKKLYYSFILIFVCCIFSNAYSNLSGNLKSITPAYYNNISQPDTSTDTLLIDKKSVIFFVPDRSEFEALLIKKGGDISDVEHQYSELNEGHKEFKEILQEAGIYSQIVHNKVFKFVTPKGIEYFNRTQNFDSEIGVIVFDGINKPVIELDINDKVESSIMKMVEANSNE